MKMGLETWLSLQPHQPTIAETQQLFEVVDRDLTDASKDLSPDTRFSLAYNAALKLCTIALHAEGYETKRRQLGQHLTAINSLEHTLGEELKETMVFLYRCSTKRGQAMYERVGVVSRQDADDLVQTARKLRADVVTWLRRRHPGLVPDGVK